MPKTSDDTTERTAFGERLHAARTHKGLSQRALGEAVGLSQSTINGLEKSGQGSARTARLAEATGVRIQWLERGEGPMLDASEVPAQARTVASEGVVHNLVGRPGGADYRTIVLSLADSLAESGVEVSVAQFIKLVEATYEKLKP